MITAELIDGAVVREIAELGEDPDGARRLLDGFANDARRTLAAMHDWAVRGEAALVARAAHRLKGTSGSVGATRLAAECLSMERSAREGRTAGLPNRVYFAIEVLDATRAAFSYVLAGSKLLP